MMPSHSPKGSAGMPRSATLHVFTNGIFLGFVLVSLLADQLTKLFVRTSLYMGETISVIGPLKIHYVTNTGALFGLFQGQTGILLILSTFGVFILLFFYAKSGDHTPGYMACMGLILGGALGNQLDRLLLSHVTDFIEIQGYPWIFNVADSAVVVGVTGIAVLTIFADKLRPSPTYPNQLSGIALLWANSNDRCSYDDETWALADLPFETQTQLPYTGDTSGDHPQGAL